MTKIYLIRHAEAEGNLYRRIQGQCDVNVTCNGRRQIAALEQRFRDIPVDACFSSDLTRTRSTARAVCGPKGLPLRLDPDFREISLGRWENVPFGQLYTCEPELMQVFDDRPQVWLVEGAESYDVYTKRFLAALDRAVKEYPEGTVCVFSHGAVIRGAMQVLFPGLAVGHADNTAVTHLLWDGSRYEAVYFNDNSHLSEEISTLARQNWWREDGDRRDHNLWFRSGGEPAASVKAPEHSQAFSAYLEQEPVGAVFLRERDALTGELVHMELFPDFRGQDLAVQLLGQAVFEFRRQGKARLVLPGCAGPAVDRFCRRFGLTPLDDGWCMDLRVVV